MCEAKYWKTTFVNSRKSNLRRLCQHKAVHSLVFVRQFRMGSGIRRAVRDDLGELHRSRPSRLPQGLGQMVPPTLADERIVPAAHKSFPINFLRRNMSRLHTSHCQYSIGHCLSKQLGMKTRKSSRKCQLPRISPTFGCYSKSWYLRFF